MLLEKYGNRYCLKDCKILFANFKGRATRYNPEGNRNFNVRIDDPAIAQELANDGFNVKLLNKLEPDAPDSWCLKITIRYNREHPEYNPQIKEVFDDRSADLDEGNVHCLDDMTVKKAIVEFRGFVYDDAQHKCSAYLNRAKFWVVDDWFSEEQKDVIGHDMLGIPVTAGPEDDDIPF